MMTPFPYGDSVRVLAALLSFCHHHLVLPSRDLVICITPGVRKETVVGQAQTLIISSKRRLPKFSQEINNALLNEKEKKKLKKPME